MPSGSHFLSAYKLFYLFRCSEFCEFYGNLSDFDTYNPSLNFSKSWPWGKGVVQVVYLGGDPRKCCKGVGSKAGKKGSVCTWAGFRLSDRVHHWVTGARCSPLTEGSSWAQTCGTFRLPCMWAEKAAEMCRWLRWRGWVYIELQWIQILVKAYRLEHCGFYYAPWDNFAQVKMSKHREKQ